MAGRAPTRLVLWWLLGALVGTTVVVLGTSVWAIDGSRRAATAVRSRTAPSILEVATARSALVKADAAAVASFRAGHARLAGPGEEYQNQIAVASQSLAKVAEDSVAGESSSQRIQLVEGLLVAYQGLIAQADAEYRQGGDGSGGAIELWSASHLLRAPDQGILAQLDALAAEETRVLDRQVSTGWLDGAAVLVWAGPAAVLLVLLLGVQVYLSRRFRRALNPSLVLATLVLLALVGVTSTVLAGRGELHAARTALARVQVRWDAQVGQVERQGQDGLDAVLRTPCGTSTTACGPTIERFRTDRAGAAPAAPAGNPPAGTEQITDRALAADIGEVNTHVNAAANSIVSEASALVLALTVLLLVVVGLTPRIVEYWHRSA